MLPLRTIGAAALLAVPAASAPAQSVKTLSKPEAEFAEPFTNVAGVRELKDGRVVAIDMRDKIVQLVDFKTGSATKVGREGSGPGEYALPMRLVALPGDSSAVFDPLNARLLVVLPNGKPGNFITLEQSAPAGPGGGMRMGIQPTRYSDAKGRLYWTGAPFRMSEGGPPKVADSVPVLRYDRSTKKSDTVAYVRVPKNNTQASGNSGNMRVMIGAANPFAPRDEWAVTPDGRIAVIRSPEYRVDWFGPSGATVGSPIAYDKIKVSEKHKQNWRDSRKNQVAMRISMENGQRSVSAGPPPAGEIPDPTDWPDLMPPFLDNAATVAPNGTIWIARTRQANDDVPKYDVIDASGKVVMRVELPKKTRLVGIGNGVIYTVRTDEDDLQYLQRFRI
jgi:hypothetical protein